MNVKMSKAKTLLFIAAIFLSNVFVQGYFIIIPIADALYEMFPGQTGLINFVISGDFLVITIVSLFISGLFKYFSKKTIMVVSGIISSVSGICMMAIENALFMCAMKAIYAVGVAGIAVTGIAILAEVYADDEKQYSTLMGLYNSSMALIGASLSAIAGNLASISIKTTFAGYWIFVPVTILFILFLPSIKPRTAATENVSLEDNSDQEDKKGFGKNFWITLIDFIIFNYCFSVMMYLNSTYITENSLGDMAYIGYFGAVCTVASFITCLFFGKLFEVIGKKLIVFLYGISAVMLLLFWLYPNPVLSIIAYFIMGGCYGLAFSFCYAYCPAIVPKKQIDQAIGLVTAGYSIAYFITTYIVTWTMQIMGTDLLTPTLIVPFIACIIITVVELIKNRDKVDREV